MATRTHYGTTRQERFEPFDVHGEVRRELDDQDAELGAEFAEALVHPFEPRDRVVELAELAQPARRLDRDDETLGHPFPPDGEDSGFGHR